jgi:ABC-type multidrug transport system ATPase subunit
VAVLGKYVVETNEFKRRSRHVRARGGVTFRARRGSVLALVGNNGEGKTTLVDVPSTSPPTSGSPTSCSSPDRHGSE